MTIGGIVEVSPGVFTYDWFLDYSGGVELDAQIDLVGGRVRLDVFAPAAPDGALVSITRRHPSGRVFTIRAATLAVFSGAGVYYDHELPISGTSASDDRTCVYEATVYNSDGTVWMVSNDATVQWVTTDDWLKDPGIPSRDMRVLIQDTPDTSYGSLTGLFYVQGRPTPIPVTDVRQSATGTISIVTLEESDRDTLHLLTSTGNVLLVQTPPGRELGNMYIAVTGITESRFVALGDRPERLWVLSYAEVDPPTGGIVTPGFNYATLDDLYPTYQLAMDAFNDYIDMIEANIESTVDSTLAWRGA